MLRTFSACFPLDFVGVFTVLPQPACHDSNPRRPSPLNDPKRRSGGLYDFTTVNYVKVSIAMGVPLFIIHFGLEFSLINHPFWVPPFMKTAMCCRNEQPSVQPPTAGKGHSCGLWIVDQISLGCQNWEVGPQL